MTEETKLTSISDTRYIQAGYQNILKLNFESTQLLINRIKTNDLGLMAGVPIIGVYGCGGIGSHFITGLPASFKQFMFYLFDFDIIETRNLERQKFPTDSEDNYKADTLMNFLNEYGFSNIGSAPDRVDIAILSSDSALARLYTVMNVKAKWFIHTSNNKYASHTFLIDGSDKTQLLGYMTYLLGGYEFDLVETRNAGGCAATPVAEQTAMANFNTAVAAIRIIQSLTKVDQLVFKSLPGVYIDDWALGFHQIGSIESIQNDLISVGTESKKLIAGPLLEKLRNDFTF